MTDIIPTKQVKDLAEAIAHAEGFGADPNNVPTRAHNPGDLKIPGWTGKTTGVEGISVFETDEEGWQALYSQLTRIANNLSHVYNLKMTLAQFATKWTDTQQSNWLLNILFKLVESGYTVDKNTMLGDYFEGNLK